MQDSEEEAVMLAINKEFKKYLSNAENVENSANSLVDDLIDDAVMSVVFEVDIMRKARLDNIMQGESNADNYQMVDVPGLDIFGQSVSEKNNECVCPCCNRTLAASRFAGHLAKCMGMGRNSSRIARNRIASNANKDVSGTSSGAISDDDDDADWTVMTEKKGKKKKEKITSKTKLKNPKSAKNGNLVLDSASNSSSTNISYESMSDRDRRVLLTQICGVISEHTKKVCTKTSKCPLHTEEQKKAVRDLYLTDAVDSYLDNLQIDVDTYEEEGDLVKESLVRSWEAEHSNTSSPADSASTSSSSSKKRDKASFKMKIKD